ncbi:uncharacterized protein [Zea mays]|uniref:uncharacterized protein n=1 Tax=Zea mays TaxID=4577 RepID=UPI0002208976|nr:uncharacterized protein LOC103648381 [Zea mays]|eukprot:XP_023157536.1 uncharacterized protein LOC103648381 [Zea mays]
MESKSPSTSCVISPAATLTMSAGESSWAMHIANFLASTPQDGTRVTDGQQPPAVPGGSGSSFSSSSSFDSFSDDASFITSEFMCNDDEDDDESVKDTACSSSAAAQQKATMENFHMKQMAATDAKQFNDMPQLMVYMIALQLPHLVLGDRRCCTYTCFLLLFECCRPSTWKL